MDEEIINSLEIEQKNPAEQIARDFRLSFHFSQGDPATQLGLFVALGRKYKEEFGEINLDEIDKKMRKSIVNYRVPNKHASTNETGNDQISSQEVFLEFEKTWKAEYGVLMNIFNGVPIRHEEEDSPVNPNKYINLGNTALVKYICEGILDKDLNFQIKERPHRSGGDDLHESFLKKYVYDRKNIGSSYYSQIMDDIKSYIDNNPDQTTYLSLYELKNGWEINHPGQKFDE